MLALLISTAINWSHTTACQRERERGKETERMSKTEKWEEKREEREKKSKRERVKIQKGEIGRIRDSEEEREKEKRGSGLKYPPS